MNRQARITQRKPQIGKIERKTEGLRAPLAEAAEPTSKKIKRNSIRDKGRPLRNYNTLSQRKFREHLPPRS